MSVENLVFSRVDDRLIHGQVCTAWIHAYHVKHILVVDDKTSKDPFMADMFSLLIPKGITIEIRSTADAIDILKKGFTKPTMMIVKFPKTIKDLVDAGVPLDFLNVGGMGMTAGRKKFYQNISVTEEEKEIFRYLVNHGCKVEIQIIPAQKKFDVSQLL